MSESRVFLCSILVIHSAVSRSCHGFLYTVILLTFVHHIRLDAVKNGKRWIGHTFAFNSFSFQWVNLQLSHAEWQEGTPVTAAQFMGQGSKFNIKRSWGTASWCGRDVQTCLLKLVVLSAALLWSFLQDDLMECYSGSLGGHAYLLKNRGHYLIVLQRHCQNPSTSHVTKRSSVESKQRAKAIRGDFPKNENARLFLKKW